MAPMGACCFSSFLWVFLFSSGGLAEADFTSLEGVIQLFKNTTPLQ